MIGFLTRNIRWIAGGFLLTFFSSFGQTFFISASVAEWQDQFNLTHGGFGRLYMIATLASAMTLPYLGKIVDIVQEHLVILGVIPTLALATVMVAFAPTIIVLVIGIYLLRLFGQGMMTHIALTATGKWFAATRGRAVSLVVLGHNVGEMVTPLAFVGLSAWQGYRAGWLTGTLALLLIALPLCVWAYSKPREPKGHVEDGPDITATRQWTRAEVLRDPILYILLTGVLAPPFIGTTIFFHQDYMTELRGWPAAGFASALGIMAMTTIIVALIAGALIDRVGSKRILPFFLLPLATSCFIAAAPLGVPGLYAFMIILGVSYGFSSTLFGALWPEVYGTEHLGAVRSAIVSALVFATAAGPGLTGTLIDRGYSLPVQLTWMGVYCLFASGLMAVAS